jgi:hypothetical protein
MERRPPWKAAPRPVSEFVGTPLEFEEKAQAYCLFLVLYFEWALSPEGVP